MKIMWILSMLVTVSMSANREIKEAFIAGIKESIKVIEYERSLYSKPIMPSYCLELKAKNRLLKHYEKIKMESLALYLGLNPALFRYKKRALLCLSVADNEDILQKDRVKIKREYPEIENYQLHTFPLSLIEIERILPIVGVMERVSQDTSKPRELILDEPVPTLSRTLYENAAVSVAKTAIPNLYSIHSKQERVSGIILRKTGIQNLYIMISGKDIP